MIEIEALKIIQRPYITEKTFDVMEKQNKMVFIVEEKANKYDIKNAIELLYKVKVMTVRTTKTLQGKKAYIRFDAESSAAELASQLGVV